MTDYTISCKLSNETVYACYRGRFWRWDGSIWKESHLMTKKFERAKAADKKLTPQAFLTNGAEFAPLDEYEIDCAMLDALENAKPCKNAPIEPMKEESECQTSTPAASPAKNSSAPAANADSSSVAPAVQSMTATEAVTFDFGADDQTNALLLQDAQTFITGNMARIMAAKHAHDLTANHYQGSWGKWCTAVGISRDTGDNMVRVAEQFGNIQLEGKSILDVQPMKLLYAAAKPSTPEVVKQAVFTGDITTYKEYQELMAQLKAEKERADAAEAHLEAANADINGLAERAQKAESERDKARADQLSTAKDCNRLGLKASQEKARADKAEARAKDAENQLSGSRQVAEAAKLRADKLQEENAALKKQPIAAVVDEEEVERRAKALAHQWDEEELDRLAAEKAWGLADARNSELAKDNADLRKQLATLQARANDNTQADFETANYCASLFRSAWDTCKGSYSRLTGEDLESTFQTLCSALNSIMEEASLLCRQPADYDGGAADEPDV